MDRREVDYLLYPYLRMNDRDEAGDVVYGTMAVRSDE